MLPGIWCWGPSKGLCPPGRLEALSSHVAAPSHLWMGLMGHVQVLPLEQPFLWASEVPLPATILRSFQSGPCNVSQSSRTGSHLHLTNWLANAPERAGCEPQLWSNECKGHTHAWECPRGKDFGFDHHPSHSTGGFESCSWNACGIINMGCCF